MVHTIQRPSGGCEFDDQSKPTAVAEYYDDISLGNDSGFIIDCSGDHKGPPIRVIVVNPRLEWDGDRHNIDYDKITYEDGEKIDDIVDDTYHDAIMQEVKNCITT